MSIIFKRWAGNTLDRIHERKPISVYVSTVFAIYTYVFFMTSVISK